MNKTINYMQKFNPYYAVIFTSKLTNNTYGYEDVAANMIRLAQQQQGFRGFDNARNQIGISVSYWDDLESIKKWKRNTDHLIAQQQGKEQWYQWYHTRICKVEHEYNMN